MALGNLVVNITLSNAGFTAGLAASGTAVQTFTTKVAGANSVVASAGKSMGSFGSSVKDLVLTLGLAREALQTVWDVTIGWAKDIVDTNSTLERMQVLLRGMSEAATDAARSADGLKQFNTIIDLAKNAPFSLHGLQDAFVRFKSGGLDPVNGSLKSLADAVANFGGNDQSLDRAALAFQQMAGKGVIAMEELRRQLGEAVPTAITQMAAAMGITMADLVKKISSGTVEAKPALDKLFAQFDLVYGGSAQNMMATFSGQIAKLKTNWILFQAAVGSSMGTFQDVKTTLTEINTIMDPTVTKKFSDAIAAGMKEVLDSIVQDAEFLYQYSSQIGDIIKAFAGLWAVMKIGLPVISSITAAWKALGLTQVALDAIYLMSSIRSLGDVFAALSLAGESLGAVLKTIFLANPVGWVVGAAAAVVGLIYVWDKYGDSVKNATRNLEEHEGLVTGKDLADSLKALNESSDKLTQMQSQMADLKQQIITDNASPSTMPMATAAQSALDDITAKYKVAYAARLKLQTDYNAAKIQYGRSQASIEATALETNTQYQITALRARFKQEETDFSQHLTTTGQSNVESAKQILAFNAKAQQELLAAGDAYYSAQIAIQTKLRSAALGKGNTDAAATAQRNIDTLSSLKKQFDTATAADMEKLTNPNGILASQDPNKTPAGRMLESLTVSAAELQAQLDKTGTHLAAVQAMIDGHKFDVKGIAPSSDQLAAIVVAASNLDKLELSVKDFNATAESTKNAFQTIQKASADAGDELAKAQEALQFEKIDPAQAKLQSFITSMDKVRASLKATQADTATFNAAVAGLTTTFGEASVDTKLADLAQSSLKIQDSLISNSKDRLDKQISDEQEAFSGYLTFLESNTKVTQDQLDTLTAAQSKNIALQRKQFDMAQPMNAMLTNWKNTTLAMETATSQWLSSGVDAFATFVATGKADWKSLVTQILEDIVKIALRAEIAKAMSPVGDFFQNMFGGVDSAALGTDASAAVDSAFPFAKGGIMSSAGPVMLHKYATGGVANSPQVAVYGEGDKPEAYVPLPDGRSIPVSMTGGGKQTMPDVQVNVINQSGQDVSAQKGQTKFDGNKYVLDVVLQAASRPGSFRDNMRAAVR